MQYTLKAQLIREYLDFEASGLNISDFATKKGYTKKEAKIIVTAGKEIQSPDEFSRQIEMAKKAMKYTGMTAPELSKAIGLRYDSVASLLRIQRKIPKKNIDALIELLPPSEKNTITPTEKKY